MVNDFYQVVAIGSHTGQAVMNVMHYNQTAGPNQNELAIATAWETAFKTLWKNVHTVDYTLRNILVQKIAPNPIGAPYMYPVAGGTGTVIADALPPANAVVITKRTAFGGTAGRGRIYLGAVPVTWVDGGLVLVANLATYQTLANALANNLVSGGSTYTPCVYRRSTKTGTVITEMVARQTMRCQRRRQVGRGI